MGAVFWRVAVFAAVFPTSLLAQDVTLTSRDGSLAISGTLQGYDGEFFRVDSKYGLLTVDAQGVICDGPACPDLTAPKAVIRFVGESDAGAALLLPVVEAFAVSRGLRYIVADVADGPDILADPATGKVLAEISFQSMTPADARDALKAGRADMIVSSQTSADFGAWALAMDALVPVVAPDNPLPGISTLDLAMALAGDVSNWAQIGGPDMPLVLHGLEPGSDLQQALSARLGRKVAATITHVNQADLAAAVAKDPWALAVTGQAIAGAARKLPMADSCGFPLLPSRLAVKAQDYPLTLPVYLITPRRRLPLMARELLEFLALPTAQATIAKAGYIDRTSERQPMTADGLRLINAIQGAGDETTLADLKRLVDLMAGADRLSLTFRFEDGSDQLDPASRENLLDLARLIEAEVFQGQILYLAGFSDGSGSAADNIQLSQKRATTVLDALKIAAPSMVESQMPKVVAFGEALPMACDETGPGRRLNRRVEVWLKPTFMAPL